jgi:aryl carrier-like protein
MAVYLQQQFAAVLGVAEEEVPLAGNLFELGLDSLMTMDVVNRLKTDFDNEGLSLRVGVNMLAEQHTVEQLSLTLAAEMALRKIAVSGRPSDEIGVDLEELRL